MRTRGWDWLLWVGLACWAVGFAWHWARPSLWLLDLVLVPAMAMLYGLGAVAVVVAVVGGRRWWVLLLVGPMPALMILVNPGWRVAPEAYFHLHRPLFELAKSTSPGSAYYGAPLPPALRFLTVNGNVSGLGDEEGSGRDTGGRFFPQWIGTPDDAGGYLYSPEGSPAGVDMYGMTCSDPVDLGGGWWTCGL